MPLDDDDIKKVFIAGLGALAGAAILQSHHDEKHKSQAEKNGSSPKSVIEVEVAVMQRLAL